MAVRCLVCDHPDREAIEQALAQGDSQRQIAQRFQVGKSTLGRHTQHVTGRRPAAVVPGPLSRAQACPVLRHGDEGHGTKDPALPTVAQAQVHLAQLETRVATFKAERETLQGQVQVAQALYRQAVWKNDAVQTGQVQTPMKQLTAQLQDLTELQTMLENGIQEATSELAAAQARRREAERQHWLWVKTQVSDPFEQWVCLLAAHQGGPAPRAPLADHEVWKVHTLRPQVAQRLREQFPFAEEGTSYAVSGLL